MILPWAIERLLLVGEINVLWGNIGAVGSKLHGGNARGNICEEMLVAMGIT